VLTQLGISIAELNSRQGRSSRPPSPPDFRKSRNEEGPIPIPIPTPYKLTEAPGCWLNEWNSSTGYAVPLIPDLWAVNTQYPKRKSWVQEAGGRGRSWLRKLRQPGKDQRIAADEPTYGNSRCPNAKRMCASGSIQRQDKDNPQWLGRSTEESKSICI